MDCPICHAKNCMASMPQVLDYSTSEPMLFDVFRCESRKCEETRVFRRALTEEERKNAELHPVAD